MSEEKKKKKSFTIISDDSTDGHGGFGGGSISLENMSSIIVDPEEDKAYVDMDAMHARSNIERRDKYLDDRNEVPEPRLYWIVWVTVELVAQGPNYEGVRDSDLIVFKKNKRAVKSMAEHVGNMEKSLKGKITGKHMDEKSKSILKEFLENF